MKGRKQKISQDTCLPRDRAEPEAYAGGQTYMGITENNFTNADQTGYGLLEQILSPTNMNQAYKKVKGNKGSGGIDKMKERIKMLTSRSNGWGDARRKEELRQYITCWVNYFKLADIKSLLLHVDEWYRRRLRMVIWKQWKRIRTRLRNLIKLGINKSKAWEYANTRKGYWHTANSPILTRSINNDRLQHAGYIFFSDYYRRVVNLLRR